MSNGSRRDRRRLASFRRTLRSPTNNEHRGGRNYVREDAIPSDPVLHHATGRDRLAVELPLLGYVIAPARTQRAVARFRAWLARRGRHALIVGAAVIPEWVGFRLRWSLSFGN